MTTEPHDERPTDSSTQDSDSATEWTDRERAHCPLPDGGRESDAPRESDAGDSDGPPTEEVTDVEAEEILEELERKRSARGVTAVALSAIAIAFSAYQLWLAARGFELTIDVPLVGTVTVASLQLLQANAIHVTFALILAFLLFPPTDGDGFVAKQFGRVVPALRERLGAENPLTRGANAVRSAVRWFVVDAERERVTPLDGIQISLAALAGIYFITSFEEIQLMRNLGLQAGETIPEVYPFLALPIELISTLGLPLDEVSYAYFLGIVGVLLVLEATRRALGLPLTLIVASFIVYARYGYLIPLDTPIFGVLSIQQSDWGTIVRNLWYNTENGVFGIPVTVSVQFIYIFILFGAFLEMSGAGQWFIDLAYAATGTRKGGPAKASILASGFMGTISGSSIANTVTTGAFTIPLMKRSGYRAEFAGAVEASASSGGQILPPVMGAAAFLIVEYIGIPFADVIVAAAIPAVVFFFGVWVMVHLEASRADIGGLGMDDVVELRGHLQRGWFYLVPLVLLLYYLLGARLSVARSAWFTIVAILALLALVTAYNERTRVPLAVGIVVLTLAEFGAYLTAGTGLLGALSGNGGAGLPVTQAAWAAMGGLGTIIIVVSVVTLLVRPWLDAPLLNLDEDVDDAARTVAERADSPRLADAQPYRYGAFVLKSMDSGARTATEVVVAVAAAGIIPGVVATTGLGPNLVAVIKAVAAGSIVLLLVITAISCIILGMGMPTTVTYIILVSLLGEALAAPEYGIPLLAAHLFILYFGVIADITPPVAVAAYAASGVAKSDPFQTGVEAFSLSLNKAIVPFAFVLTPGILLLRRKVNAEGVPVGEREYQVLSAADVADLGFFVPEVAIPVLGVFVGVVALGVTVIGYLYDEVSSGERALFALAALLLMAPSLLLVAVGDVAALAGMNITLSDSVTVDLTLRLAGGVIFGLLTMLNRWTAGGGRERIEEQSTVTD